jgi:hypothetical protein
MIVTGPFKTKFHLIRGPFKRGFTVLLIILALSSLSTYIIVERHSVRPNPVSPRQRISGKVTAKDMNFIGF